jgi:hypothetical protein
MTPFDLFLAALLAGFSAIMLSVALMAYRARRDPRMAFLSMAFLLLLAMAAAAAIGGLLDLPYLTMGTFSLVLCMAVVAFMYLAILRR